MIVRSPHLARRRISSPRRKGQVQFLTPCAITKKAVWEFAYGAAALPGHRCAIRTYLNLFYVPPIQKPPLGRQGRCHTISNYFSFRTTTPPRRRSWRCWRMLRVCGGLNCRRSTGLRGPGPPDRAVWAFGCRKSQAVQRRTARSLGVAGAPGPRNRGTLLRGT